MKTIMELTRAFYGVNVPFFKQRKYLTLVLGNLDNGFSIETAIGLALREINLAN